MRECGCQPEIDRLERQRDEARDQRDAIEGLLTSQPGADPTPRDASWSTAYEAAAATLAAARDAEMALRVLLHEARAGKTPDVERFAHIALRHHSPLRADRG